MLQFQADMMRFSTVERGAPAFLGFATLEFDDASAFEKTMASPEFAAALADAVNFTEPDRLEAAFVEHVPIME